MATTSPFDPDKVDPEFYSQNPNQHGTSDYGHESAGVSASTSGVDINDVPVEPVAGEGSMGTTGQHANEGSGNGWDVDPAVAQRQDGKLMSDEAARKLDEVAENPSDDALLHRADATYLEQGDDPGKGYDPHNKGYDGKDKESVS
ncbi:hypothetical protein GCM10027578_43350 [Spirosoma luteolum]